VRPWDRSTGTGSVGNHSIAANSQQTDVAGILWGVSNLLKNPVLYEGSWGGASRAPPAPTEGQPTQKSPLLAPTSDSRTDFG